MAATLLLDTPVAGPRSAGVAAARPSGAEVLAVIPTLNEAAHIEACVRSLMNGDERLKAVDLVVADGGSSDETRRIVLGLQADFPNLRLIDNPRRLQSAAVNRAARGAADRQILVRCDAHAIYPDNYIMRIADSLARRNVASVVTPMDSVGKTCFQKAVAWIVDTPLGSGGAAHRGGRASGVVDHGHHAGFLLEHFLRVGGYDETFAHNEDAEFDTRLRQAGGVIFLDADIRLAYLPRASARALARQYFNYGKGRARTILKHGERPRLRQLIPPATLLGCIAGLALAPLSPWTLLFPGAYAATLAAASLAIAALRRSACGLFAGPASAIIHMSWSAGLLSQLIRGQRP